MSELPPGWVETGTLPSRNPATQTDPDAFASLDEDLWMAESPGGRFLLDVGWYPEGDASGAFTCVLVEGGDWEQPTSRLRTRELPAVRAWVDKNLVRVVSILSNSSGVHALGTRSYIQGSRRWSAEGIHAGS